MEKTLENFNFYSIFQKTFEKDFFAPIKPMIKKYARPKHSSPASIQNLDLPVHNDHKQKGFSNGLSLPRISRSTNESILSSQWKSNSESPNRSAFSASSPNGSEFVSIDTVREKKRKNQKNLFFGSPRKYQEGGRNEPMDLFRLENTKKVVLLKRNQPGYCRIVKKTFRHGKDQDSGAVTHKKAKEIPLAGWESSYSRISFKALA